MRQVGVLAAAGLVALDETPPRLLDDHANARFLAEGLSRIPGIQIDPARVQTNIVVFDVSGTRQRPRRHQRPPAQARRAHERHQRAPDARRHALRCRPRRLRRGAGSRRRRGGIMRFHTTMDIRVSSCCSPPPLSRPRSSTRSPPSPAARPPRRPPPRPTPPSDGRSRAAVDSAGNVYFSSNHSVYRLASNGTLTLVAGNGRAGFSGDGGPAVSAQLNAPKASPSIPAAISTSPTPPTTASARSTAAASSRPSPATAASVSAAVPAPRTTAAPPPTA